MTKSITISLTFLVMKNSLVIFLLLLLSYCKPETPSVSLSYLHKVVDTLDINRSGNILVYTINPNDCVSCLNAFKLFDDNLNGDSSSRIYVIAVNRMIERESMEKQIVYPDLHAKKNKAVLWGRDLFDSINYCGGTSQPMTTVMVYNHQIDSILYSKPVREVLDMREISTELGKKLAGN